MIPKIIHYCWISDESNMSQKIKDCIESWHKYMPEYQFINWNDSNINWNICGFTKHCRKNNLYAFCADYVRFWALYNYGGIYLDCDVMVYKSFNNLLTMKRILTKEPFTFNDLPYKNDFRIEAAIIGAEKNDKLFEQLTNFYLNTNMRPFDTCEIAPDVIYNIIEKNNYQLNNIQNIEEENNSENIINLLDVNKYFHKDKITKDTYATHLFSNSWLK